MEGRLWIGSYPRIQAGQFGGRPLARDKGAIAARPIAHHIPLLWTRSAQRERPDRPTWTLLLHHFAPLFSLIPAHLSECLLSRVSASSNRVCVTVELSASCLYEQ